MARYVRALVALLVAFALPVFAAELPWTNPGMDPCRKNPKCTLEYTLKRSGWKAEVQSALIANVKTVSPEIVRVKKGDRFDFMAFGARPGTEHVAKNVVAAWKDGHGEPARLWAFEFEGFRHELIVPDVCSNYSGRKVKLPPRVEKPDAPKLVMAEPKPERMPLGVVPIATCY